MKLTHYHATILFWIGLLIFSTLSVFGYKYYFVGEKQEQIFCTQDAMQCPDGSYVGREGPNCEFHCPSEALCEGGRKCPELNNDGDFRTYGTVSGKVSIGPLCPVEPCNSTVDPYSGKQLIFKPTGGGRPVDQPFYAKLKSDGLYSIELPSSNYSVTISDCQYMGCSAVFPKNITVTANKNLELNIDIDTGIR